MIPILAIAAFAFFGLSWRYMLFAIAVVCPLMHFIAMQKSGSHDGCTNSHSEATREQDSESQEKTEKQVQ